MNGAITTISNTNRRAKWYFITSVIVIVLLIFFTGWYVGQVV